MNQNRAYILAAFICLIFFSACGRERSGAGSFGTPLDGLGITLEIPEMLVPMPEEMLIELQPMTFAMPPFTVTPRYAYGEIAGRAILIVSELTLTDAASAEEDPFEYILTYKRNLKAHFGVEEITNDVMVSNDITTLLLAMLLGDDALLFKGLSYISPNRFVMIDLHIFDDVITPAEALSLHNIFNSMRRS